VPSLARESRFFLRRFCGMAPAAHSAISGQDVLSCEQDDKESGLPINPLHTPNRLTRFANTDALCQAIAAATEAAVTQAIAQRGSASLALSGGSTPVLYLPHIARLALPWERVHVTLTDERWVPADHAWSNAGLLNKTLFTNDAAQKASFTPLTTTDHAAADAIATLEQNLKAIPHPYDLVLLGMGSDGHTASLFPGMPGLARALAQDQPARLVAVPPPAHMQPAVARMSMTMTELHDSRRRILVLQGTDKLAVYEQALSANDPLLYPVCALVDTEVFWCP
jgi:6-phosphogluconolactonase